MHPRKNTHRHEDSSLEKNNLITIQEGWFFSLHKYQKKAIWLVVKDWFMPQRSPLNVSTLDRWGTGPLDRACFASKAHPQPMVRRGLSWSDISFCPQPSAAPIVLPYWDWVGISLSLLYWVGKKLHLGSPRKKFLANPIDPLKESLLITL